MNARNFKKSALAAVLAGGMALPMAASADFLKNWYFDADADGDLSDLNALQVTEYFDITGSSYIENYPTATPGLFNFSDQGVFQVSGASGASIFDFMAATTVAGDPHELTAIFEDGMGTVSIPGGLNFTGGSLSLYFDNRNDPSTLNYGDDSDQGDGIIFGANDGLLIGSFTLADGYGVVDPSGVPNGNITLIFEATFLEAGYFYDEGGNDLSTLIGTTPDPILFGFVTTNASEADPSLAQQREIIGELGGNADGLSGTFVANPPQTLFVSNNGQYRWSIPEPATLLLMGGGLLGLGLASRRRKGASAKA